MRALAPLASLALLVPAAALVALGQEEPKTPRAVLVRGGRVHTVAGPAIEDGAVLVVDGKIARVGPSRDVAAPAGARVIDASGKQVLPPLFDVAPLGLVEIDEVSATVDQDEGSSPVVPQVRAIDAFNPASEAIPVARANGVLYALTCPGDGDVFAGQGAVVLLDGTSAADMALSARASVHVSLGEPVKARWDERKQLPSTRMGIAAVLRKTLSDAREYLLKLRRFEKKRAKFEAERLAHEAKVREGKATAADAPEPPDPLERDATLEALVPALENKVPVVARARRADDVATALSIAEDFGLTLVISQGSEAWRLAPRLAEKKVPVIVTVTDQPDAPEARDARYENAARLYAAGVPVLIATRSAHNSRHLPYEAGLAVAYGLPWEAALAAITKVPATTFGVADRVGTLELGKRGDLVVVDGDPFEPRTRVVLVLAGGREASLESRHTRLFEKHRPR